MSRDEGFTRADVDTALLADPKVVRLARQLRDPRAIAATLCLFTGLVLASWKAGDRVTLEESLPAWWLEPIDAELAALLAADLVDVEGRIHVHAWASWYEPARERRDLTLERWRRSNDKRRRGGRADDAALPRGDEGEPVPTGQVQQDRSDQVRPLRVVQSTTRGGTPRPDASLRDTPGQLEVDRV